MRKTVAWRWGNVPLPEPHLAGLGVGIALQVIASWTMSWPAWLRHGLGWPLALAGLCLATWALRAAASVDMERPDQIVLAGPYAFSRNPMYLAWTSVYVGVALVVSTVWLLLLLPAVLLLTHATVVAEERSLERRFGSAYRSYKTSVRRYL